MRGFITKTLMVVLLAFATVLFFAVNSARAETATSVVNSGGQDAYVRFMMPMNNFGGEADLWAGGAQASDPRLHNFFIQFQLPSIPTGATVNSANIQLYFYG